MVANLGTIPPDTQVMVWIGKRVVKAVRIYFLGNLWFLEGLKLEETKGMSSL
jgi:hypothetical protein